MQASQDYWNVNKGYLAKDRAIERYRDPFASNTSQQAPQIADPFEDPFPKISTTENYDIVQSHRPQEYLTPSIIPTPFPDFMHDSREDLRVSLSEDTLNKLFTVQVPDPADTRYLAEGRPQRKINRQINLAAQGLSLNEKLEGLDAVIRGGNVATRGEAIAVATQLASLVDSDAKIMSLSRRSLAKLGRVAARLGLGETYKNSGLKRLWAPEELKENYGAVMLWVMANTDIKHIALPLSYWTYNKISEGKDPLAVDWNTRDARKYISLRKAGEFAKRKRLLFLDKVLDLKDRVFIGLEDALDIVNRDNLGDLGGYTYDPNDIFGGYRNVAPADQKMRTDFDYVLSHNDRLDNIANGQISVGEMFARTSSEPDRMIWETDDIDKTLTDPTTLPEVEGEPDDEEEGEPDDEEEGEPGKTPAKPTKTPAKPTKTPAKPTKTPPVRYAPPKLPRSPTTPPTPPLPTSGATPPKKKGKPP